MSLSTSSPEGEIASPLPTLLPPRLTLKGLVARTIGHVGLDVVLASLMTVILVGFLVHVGASIRWAQVSVYMPIGIMFFLLICRNVLWVVRHSRAGNGTLSLQRIFLQTCRDWIPFILIDFIYQNLRDLSEHFYTHDIAGFLMKWDLALFGVEPTLWVQRLFHPLITDYMTLAYALYFFFPLVLMYFLSMRNLRGRLREVSLALSLCFLIGFLGYILFPCSPPRFFIEPLFENPSRLYGVLLFERFQARWDSLSVISAGAFPSLHVALSTVGLIYTFRLRSDGKMGRFLYRLFLPLVISLWISTVYLRHHWFIDILAGWILAFFCCRIAPLLTRWWDELRNTDAVGTCLTD